MKKFLILAGLLLVSSFAHAQSYSPWRYIVATNCSTSNGIAQDLCKKSSDSSLWVCSSASGCSGSGWVQVGSGGGGSGTVTSVSGANGLTGTVTTSGNISGVNAVADGATKGVAAFTATDFNDDGSGVVSLDYANGQKATGSQAGFLSSTDWTTFNGKQASLSLVAGTYTDGKGCSYASSGTLLNCNNSYLTGNQSITLSGDVTGSGTTAITTVLANIPTATPAVGTILHTNIAAPSSPASGKVSIYSDSTDLRFHDKNASGVIGTTVVADTGASHNFLTAVSAAGAISKAQPAFTDISGTVAAGQLPNPSASTLGGIESLVATSHQWINTISTSGVPSSTQPVQADISGLTTASTPSFAGETLTGDLTLSTHNLVTDTTTGSDIGTATTQKIGFYGVTPIVQPSGDILTALNGTHLGLIASPTIAQADVTGLTTASSPTFTGLTVSGLTGSLPVFTTSGSALTTGTLSGNTTKLVTSTGTLTNGDCVKIDASGNYIDSGGACGGGGSSQWQTNGTSIGTTGGVVVGTTGTGSAQLTVVGNVAIGSTASDAYVTTVPPTGGMILYGNVGIGTWSPKAQLDIQSTVTNNYLNVVSGNTGIGISTTSSLNKLDVAGSAAFGSYGGVNAATSNGLIVSGNVGIGTFAPTSKLQVGTGTNTLSVDGSGNMTINTGNLTFNTASASLTVSNISAIDSGTFTLKGRDATAGSAGLVLIRGGDQNNAGGSSGSAVTIRGGNNSVNSSDGGGNASVQGGDVTNSSATGTAGNLTLRSGGSSKTTGSNGNLIIAQTFQSGGTFAKLNDVVCMNATNQPGDCATSATNAIGVAIATTAPIQVQVAGIATSVPFDGTYTPSAGWYVCTSPTTAGTVLPQSTVCSANRQIGIITVGATSVTVGTFLVQKN